MIFKLALLAVIATSPLLPSLPAVEIDTKGPGTTFYVDSRSGDDANSGVEAGQAWRSLEKLNAQ